MRDRLREDGWTILQLAAAALIAFLLARWLGGHSEPFFAPIAAVVSLNTDLGERGLNALKLLLGVVLGIVVGELTLLVVSDLALALGIAVLVSLSISTLAGGSRLLVAQAAASAVLTVSISDGSAGPERLIDALIGAGVALVFTQLLFTPDPLKLLRAAESEALSSVGSGLRRAAEALAGDDEAAAVDALAGLRETRDDLADVASARERSQRVARHSLTRRSGRRPLVVMTENAGHLDLLGDDAIMAVRLAIAADPSSRVAHGASLKRFAGLIERLAEDPASRSARQGVVDDFPAALSELGPARQCDPTVRMIRLLALDAMLYAGVEPSAAQAVIDGASDEPSVERDQDPSTTLLRRVRRSMRRGKMGP